MKFSLLLTEEKHFSGIDDILDFQLMNVLERRANVLLSEFFEKIISKTQNLYSRYFIKQFSLIDITIFLPYTYVQLPIFLNKMVLKTKYLFYVIKQPSLL